MRIDAHQHFWMYNPVEYPWMTDSLAILRKDYLPRDLAGELRKVKIEGTIAVQARQKLEENEFLLNLAESNPLIKGVVGWVDLVNDRVEEQVEQFFTRRKFVGVRHVLQDEVDDEFALRKVFVRGVSKLAQHGLTYDLLVYPRQLPACIALVEKLPEQKFVLDHIGKPSIRDRELGRWQEAIRALAKAGTVYCKISGMVTEANWKGWSVEDFKPYLDVVFEAFTPAKIMYGSDWPVCLLAGNYEQVYGIIRQYTESLSKGERERVMGLNAAEFYGLELPG